MTCSDVKLIVSLTLRDHVLREPRQLLGQALRVGSVAPLRRLFAGIHRCRAGSGYEAYPWRTVEKGGGPPGLAMRRSMGEVRLCVEPVGAYPAVLACAACSSHEGAYAGRTVVLQCLVQLPGRVLH